MAKAQSDLGESLKNTESAKKYMSLRDNQLKEAINKREKALLENQEKTKKDILSLGEKIKAHLISLRSSSTNEQHVAVKSSEEGKFYKEYNAITMSLQLELNQAFDQIKEVEDICKAQGIKFDSEMDAMIKKMRAGTVSAGAGLTQLQKVVLGHRAAIFSAIYFILMQYQNEEIDSTWSYAHALNNNTLHRLSDLVSAWDHSQKEHQDAFEKCRNEIDKDVHERLRAFIQKLNKFDAAIMTVLKIKLSRYLKEYVEKVRLYLPNVIGLELACTFGTKESTEVETAIKKYKEEIDREGRQEIARLKVKLEDHAMSDVKADQEKQYQEWRDTVGAICLAMQIQMEFMLLNAEGTQTRTLAGFSLVNTTHIRLRANIQVWDETLDAYYEQWKNAGKQGGIQALQQDLIAAIETPPSHEEVVARDRKQNKALEAARRAAEQARRAQQTAFENFKTKKIEEERERKTMLAERRATFWKIATDFDPSEKNLLAEMVANSKTIRETTVFSSLLKKLGCEISPTTLGKRIRLNQQIISDHRPHGSDNLDPGFISDLVRLILEEYNLEKKGLVERLNMSGTSGALTAAAARPLALGSRS